jgi:PAS domain S-box-containing protein
MDCRAIVGKMPYGLVVFARDEERPGLCGEYRLRATNPAFETLTRHTGGRLEGASPSAIFGSHEPPWCALFDRILESGEPVIGVCYLVAVGRAFKVSSFKVDEESVAMILSEASEAPDALATITRIEQRFRDMAEKAGHVAFRYAVLPHPRVEYVSPGVAAVTGYSPEEYYADPELPLRILTDEDRDATRELEAGKTSFERISVLRSRRKDGSVVWTESRYAPIYDDQGRLVAVEGMARDVTRQKALEQERDRLAEQLGQARARLAELERK